MPAPLVIVGASMAGLRTAEGARRAGYDGPITFLGAETHRPYNRPPLSKELLRTPGQGHDDVAFPLRSALTDNVEWVLGTPAVRLDRANRVVHDASGATHDYAALAIATGLRPKPLPIPDHGLGGIHVLRTLEDAVALRDALGPGVNVVILGSGFVGCEIAATAAHAGARVSIVTQSRVPLDRALGPILGAELRRRHEQHGVHFFCGESLFGLVGDPRVERVILTSGVMLECDLLVVAIGSDPQTDWLEGSGLEISDGVLVDGSLRALTVDGTVDPAIVAVGDIARYVNPLFDDVPRRVEHWNLPTETGKRAGQTLAAYLRGEPEEAATFAPLPSFWSDQYDAHLLAFGMTYLGDRSEVVAGSPDAECVVEYYRDDALVGVCGIGMRSAVQAYRARFAAPVG
jgi:NADPH-dependent 2,4-dienoyl-CoA reductase/sulfur reductase-like enzyme